jgi:hypothetical protein
MLNLRTISKLYPSSLIANEAFFPSCEDFTSYRLWVNLLKCPRESYVGTITVIIFYITSRAILIVGRFKRHCQVIFMCRDHPHPMANAYLSKL